MIMIMIMMSTHLVAYRPKYENAEKTKLTVFLRLWRYFPE